MIFYINPFIILRNSTNKHKKKKKKIFLLLLNLKFTTKDEEIRTTFDLRFLQNE